MLGMIEEFFFSRDRYGSDLCVYVREPYRVHAPAMIRKFLDWAWSKPRVKRVILAVSSGMDELGRTGKMYESLGFKQVGGMYYIEVPQ